MKRITFSIAAAIVAASPAGATGYAGTCTTAAKDKWMTEAVAQSKLTEAGYTVKSIKTTRAGNCFEAYATDKDGKRVELFLDPTNGNIVHTQ